MGYTARRMVCVRLFENEHNSKHCDINHWNRTEMLPDINITVKPDPEMETLDIAMVVNLVVVAVVAIVGNLLTLVALPYIRSKYRQEFSMLQLNSITLILHLSLCDLLYALLGFPHFIHAHIYKTNIYSVQVCYLLGMFRNLVAYTDFNNVALISCFLARQFLCRRVYVSCLGLWIAALMALLPDMMGTT